MRLRMVATAMVLYGPPPGDLLTPGDEVEFETEVPDEYVIHRRRRPDLDRLAQLLGDGTLVAVTGPHDAREVARAVGPLLPARSASLRVVRAARP